MTKRSSDSVRPISPGEVPGERIKSLPDVVLEAFNELIVQNFQDGRAVIVQDDVVLLILRKCHERQESVERQQIFDRHWLDVEEVYQRAGWKVRFDKPGFNETGAAYFEFWKPRTR